MISYQKIISKAGPKLNADKAELTKEFFVRIVPEGVSK